MVGVNMYAHEAGSEKDFEIPLLRIDEEVFRTQVANLKRVKDKRDPAKVKAALEAVRTAARGKPGTASAASAVGPSNLMPPIIEAAKAYCTQQEICDVLREVFGTYTDPAEF
jgi:methylmalonyl-CoA mutase N-terminal domain/subunit